MPTKREAPLRSAKAFDVGMRQLAMEFDGMDLDFSLALDFEEFSRLVRAREIAIHSETALRERFNLLDVDGSGTVDVTEFIKFALRDALSRTAVPIKSLLASWDADGTGDIGLQEFRDAIRFFGFEARNAEIDSVFHEFDRNGNGALDINELTDVLREGALPARMQQHALRKLGDREGHLTKEQAAASLEAASAQRESGDRSPAYRLEDQVEELRRTLVTMLESNQTRVLDLFRAWDEDGDGLIGRKELRHALEVLGVAAPSKVVKELFKKIDKDGSGTLQYNELNTALRRTMPAAEDEGGGSKGTLAPLELQSTTKIGLRKKASEHKLSRSFGSSMRLSLDGHDPTVPVEKALLQQLTSALRRAWAKVSHLFAEWDENGDGLISKGELRRAMKVLGLGPGGEAEHQAIDALFAAVDVDGSGTITLHELSRAIRPSGGRGRPHTDSSISLLADAPSPIRKPFKQRTMRHPPAWPQTPTMFLFKGPATSMGGKSSRPGGAGTEDEAAFHLKPSLQESQSSSAIGSSSPHWGSLASSQHGGFDFDSSGLLSERQWPPPSAQPPSKASPPRSRSTPPRVLPPMSASGASPPSTPGVRHPGLGRSRSWVLAGGKMVGGGATALPRETTPRLAVRGREAQPQPPISEHDWYVDWLKAQPLQSQTGLVARCGPNRWM